MLRSLVGSEMCIRDRQTAYYKENIGNVKSVDEFLDNYQLYSYAMDAFGLGEMTYAKAFMKKVLDSDPVSYTHLTLPTTPYV